MRAMAPHVRALGDPCTNPWQENLAMTATSGATPSAHPEHPGRTDGVAKSGCRTAAEYRGGAVCGTYEGAQG